MHRHTTRWFAQTCSWAHRRAWSGLRRYRCTHVDAVLLRGGRDELEILGLGGEICAGAPLGPDGRPQGVVRLCVGRRGATIGGRQRGMEALEGAKAPPGCSMHHEQQRCKDQPTGNRRTLEGGRHAGERLCERLHGGGVIGSALAVGVGWSGEVVVGGDQALDAKGSPASARKATDFRGAPSTGDD